MAVTLGIDPGISGAIVAIEDGRIEDQFAMPVRKDEDGKRHINEEMLLDLLLLYQGNINAIAIERQSLRPRQQGQFKLVDHHGWLRGAAAMLECKVFNPRPQVWQEIIEDAELASVYLFAPSSDDPKARSIAAAKVLLPDLDLIPGTKRTEQHGIADAGLIALWGERMYRATYD